jgi:sugar O-acyltransferase (sialic acid O-acetyltransferase NeuD family)
MWGAADQARVNAHIIDALGCELVALIDDTPGLISPFTDLPLFRGWNAFEPWLETQAVDDIGFVVAIGNPYGHVRRSLHDRLIGAGLTSVSIVDPSALICASAQVGDGLQMMPHAIVHNSAFVERQCIVNTRALVEHDCILNEGVEIGPGAVLCGRVHVGANTWVAAGATVRPRIRIGANVIIGAGAVVVSDIPDNVVAAGVPARPVPDSLTESALAELKENG